MIVKLIGAAYLLYVGVGLLLSKKSSQLETATQATTPALRYRKIFLQGFLTNVLNPKVAVFFLAFVPQFIAASAPNKALAFIVLGGIFNVNSMLWCHFLAFTSAFASRRVRVNKTVNLWINRVIGAVFVSFGIKLALADRS